MGKSMLGPTGRDGLRKFWENASGQRWCDEHPALPHLDLDHTIPLVFHCDGAEVYTNSEFYIWSFSSLMPCRCHALDCKFQIVKIPHESMRDPDVKSEIMRTIPMFIAWCCDVCAHGFAPPHDFYGDPWPKGSVMERLHLESIPLFGPWRAIFAGLKADLKARKELNFMSRSYLHVHMCDECEAVQPFPSVMRSKALRRFLYTDVSVDAAWRGSRQTHEQYLARARTVSPWIVVPGFRRELLYWDLMHIGPLGVYRDIIAATILDLLARDRLWWLLKDPDLSGKLDNEQLRALWLDFRQWCKTRKKSMPSGSLSRRLLGATKSADYPELHSRFKAVTCKWMLVYLAQLCNARPLAVLRDKIIATCLWSSAQFIHVTDHGGFILTYDELCKL